MQPTLTKILHGTRPEVAAARADVALVSLYRALTGEGVNEYTARRIERALPDVVVRRRGEQ